MMTAFFFLFMYGNNKRDINPTTIIIPVLTPHISQPKALPSEFAIPYMLSVSITKNGNEPMPPGVKIMARVDKDSTEQAAFILNPPVASMALKPK